MADAREVILAKALCCKGAPCSAPKACCAEIASHWSRQSAAFGFAALAEAGLAVVPVAEMQAAEARLVAAERLAEFLWANGTNYTDAIRLYDEWEALRAALAAAEGKRDG